MIDTLSLSRRMLRLSVVVFAAFVLASLLVTLRFLATTPQTGDFLGGYIPLARLTFIDLTVDLTPAIIGVVTIGALAAGYLIYLSLACVYQSRALHRSVAVAAVSAPTQPVALMGNNQLAVGTPQQTPRKGLPQRSETEFLGALSHEIRGPLGIILNASELVLEGLCGDLNADQAETLSMVKTNTAHLMELMGDVLDYAKLEAGRMVPYREVLAVNEQLSELCRMVRAQADGKGHTLRHRETLPALFLKCDRRHFRQILINLLTNAIKYTPDNGTIEVWSETLPSTGVVRVCVRDSGVGIPAEDRERVFAPFERLSHEYSLAQQGTGLGLSLTKRLVEVNNGEIFFESSDRGGTTFWVDLPSGRSEDHLSMNVGGHRKPARSSGDTILIVGPGGEERVIVARYLKSLGYLVQLAESEADARLALQSGRIDGVVIGAGSIPSNRGSGAPLAAFVRDTQGARYIPVVLLTRTAFLVDVERFLLEEVDRCLPKPVTLEAIAFAVEDVLSATRLKDR